MATFPIEVQTIFKCKPQLIGTKRNKYLYVDICISAASSIRFKGIKLCNALFFLVILKYLVLFMKKLIFNV